MVLARTAQCQRPEPDKTFSAQALALTGASCFDCCMPTETRHLPTEATVRLYLRDRDAVLTCTACAFVGDSDRFRFHMEVANDLGDYRSCDFCGAFPGIGQDGYCSEVCGDKAAADWHDTEASKWATYYEV